MAQKNKHKTASIPVAAPSFFTRHRSYFTTNFPTHAITFLYTVTMLVLSLKYHRIGGYEVETDFYADFVVQAKKILAGNIAVENFGLKGPIYYFLLAGFRLVFGEFFRAGLILNVLAAGGAVWTILALFRRLFGVRVAVFTTLFTISNFTFLHYTYSVGTDMVMCFFSLLTVYFLVARELSTLSLIAAGFFACLAILTRYNAIFLYPAGLLVIGVMGWRQRGAARTLADAGIFLGSSIAIGLPWYIPNALVRGNPLYNDNIIVMKLHYFPEDLAAQKAIKGIGDLLAWDPFHVISKTVSNMGVYLWNDLHELIDVHFAAFSAIGILVLSVLLAQRRVRLNTSQWVLFLFPISHFIVLLFAHYNIRFALFRVPFYGALVFIPLFFLIDRIRWNHLRNSVFILIVLVTLVKFWSGYLDIRAYHKQYNDPVNLFKFADTIKSYHLNEDNGIIARRPHLSYYTGLKNIMLPVKVATDQELYAFADSTCSRFLFISTFDYNTTGPYRFIVNNHSIFRRLKLIGKNDLGVLFEITLDRNKGK